MPGRSYFYQGALLRTANDRSTKYDSKTAATTVGLKIAAGLGIMKSQFAAAINSLAPIEQQIQGILNGEAAVPTIQYPFYLCFGRELWSLDNRGIDGAAAVLRAITIQEKWTDMGLDDTITKKIALDVFNIIVP